MNDLRAVFPTRITRGALLRSDGVAVGMVGGGAPAWDLLSLAARGQIGVAYHRLLLALDAPIDLYLVDQPPEVSRAIGGLLQRQTYAHHPLLGNVLREMADYLTELGQHSASRAKYPIWTVTVSGEHGPSGIGKLELPRIVGRGRTRFAARTQAGERVLGQAVERARRLSATLAQLGSAPPSRLLEAEEIAQLIYRLADPVRAQRYPLAGPLLERVRRAVTAEPTGEYVEPA